MGYDPVCFFLCDEWGATSNSLWPRVLFLMIRRNEGFTRKKMWTCCLRGGNNQHAFTHPGLMVDLFIRRSHLLLVVFLAEVNWGPATNFVCSGQTLGVKVEHTWAAQETESNKSGAAAGLEARWSLLCGNCVVAITCMTVLFAATFRQGAKKCRVLTAAAWPLRKMRRFLILSVRVARHCWMPGCFFNGCSLFHPQLWQMVLPALRERCAFTAFHGIGMAALELSGQLEEAQLNWHKTVPWTNPWGICVRGGEREAEGVPTTCGWHWGLLHWVQAERQIAAEGPPTPHSKLVSWCQFYRENDEKRRGVGYRPAGQQDPFLVGIDCGISC